MGVWMKNCENFISQTKSGVCSSIREIISHYTLDERMSFAEEVSFA